MLVLSGVGYMQLHIHSSVEVSIFGAVYDSSRPSI